jgi:hypothetical protein
VHAVGDAVREAHLDVDEPGLLEPGSVLRLGERSGDAADVAAALRALVHGEAVLRDDVGDAHAAARPEHAGDLGQHGRLVRREVHDAVRDDDVHAPRRERDVLDQPLQEVHVLRAGLLGVPLGEREHLVGHVEPVHGSRRPDAPRREEDIDAAARAEVEHRLAGVEVGDGVRVPAAEARGDGFLGHAGTLVGVVKAEAKRPRRLVAATAAVAASAAGAVLGAERRLRVALPHLLSKIRTHTMTPFRSRTLAARSRPSRSRL